MVANYHQSRLSPPLTSQFVKCPVTETLYFLIAGNVKANIGFISDLNVREEQKVSWVGFEPIKHFAKRCNRDCALVQSTPSHGGQRIMRFKGCVLPDDSK